MNAAANRPQAAGALPSGQAAPDSDGIGARLEAARLSLIASANRLRPGLDSLSQPLLEQARSVLERRMCRIAVVGQIKAGKSTLINALCGRPGLLPADINPWTAVVTSLHFRRSQNPPKPAAVFRMFTAAEWNALAEGGGRLRELTERLVPGFSADHLKAQFERMRQRAEIRLGPAFQQLLGQTHSFGEITRDMLSSYISAGDDPEAGARNVPRGYSDITRSAELFFSEGPFAFPSSLIDTPGTNDPFLVRDEITRRALENPDIFVFVISALQPLTVTDLSMLRLINGLQKNRILVFINRIDLLADPASDGALIRKRVEAVLAREFPDVTIKVVLGSAAWALDALQGDRIDYTAAAGALSPAVLASAGLAPLRDLYGAAPLPQDRAYAAFALYTASGMLGAVAELERMFEVSSCAAQLNHVGHCLLELAKGKEIALRIELASLSGLADTRRAAQSAFLDKIGQERQVLDNFERRAVDLDRVLDEIEAHLNDLVVKSMGPMWTELRTIVTNFSADRAAIAGQSLRRPEIPDKWVCNVMPLRDALEACYLRTCRQLGANLHAVEREIHPVLREAVDSLVPGEGDAFADVPRGADVHRPSVQPLRQTVVLDLSSSWWAAWFSSRPDPQDRANHLRVLIEEDFGPITAELVREAEAYFGWHIAHRLDRARAVAESILGTVRRRKAELEAEQTNWKGNTARDESFEERQRENGRVITLARAALVAEINRLETTVAGLVRAPAN